eukprot:CAMPEP_0119495642 /NCGR_PEP_ID=MMETSP1344-20130328/19203_1 /TAXON_ID=236787 /ORGANISM="Florenciella parvula, Strain CCMP2471" /LENGTH=216 /DNA_ID=CAMNT_0007531241 /DNA_START=200 /DNA_END=850 /DNA_ORIENTATION=+
MVLSLSTLNTVAARFPVQTAIYTTGFKSAAADALTQVILEQRQELDYRRTALFASFGCLYQGGFQYFIWNKLLERAMPTSHFAYKVVVVNGFFDPVFLFPAFYTAKELINNSSQSPAVCMSQGLSNYQENYKQDWINSWMIWVPGHVVTANLSAHLKVPWVAAVSFGYVCMLSATRGEFVVKEEQVKKASKALVRKVTKIIMPSEEEEEDDRQSRK